MHQSESLRENNRLAELSMVNVNKIIDILNKRKKSDEEQHIEIVDLNQKYKNIQKEFIAILGIFASILITAFGGLTALASLFNKINLTDIHKLIFVGTFEVLAIILIIFLMLNGIAKLTNLNLRSCDCKVEDKCVCKLHEKHPSMVVIMIILFIILFISCTPIITNKFLIALKNDTLFEYLLMYGVGIFIVLIGVYLIVRQSNYKKSKLKKQIMKNKYLSLKIKEDSLLNKEQLFYEKKIYLMKKEENLKTLLEEMKYKEMKVKKRIEKLEEIETKLTKLEGIEGNK